MKDTRARIERLRRVNVHFQQLDLVVEDESLYKVKPGQSFLARPIDSAGELHLSWHPYLRERWWAYAGPQGRLTVELPTNPLYHPGDLVTLLGPIGEPYKYVPNVHSVLLIAYDAPPIPLTVMIPSLIRSQVNTTLVLLGQAQRYDTSNLDPLVEVHRGERDLVWEGALHDLSQASQIFAVVPQDDELLRFRELMEGLQSYRDAQFPFGPRTLFGVLQAPLPCGVGACDACLVRLKDPNGGSELKRACLAGPSFDLTTLKL